MGNLLRNSGVLLVTVNSTGGVSISRPATAAAARIYARASQPSDLFMEVAATYDFGLTLDWDSPESADGCHFVWSQVVGLLDLQGLCSDDLWLW